MHSEAVFAYALLAWRGCLVCVWVGGCLCVCVCAGRHVRWLTGPSHSPSDLPSDCSTALSALLTDRLVSAANVALKSEELSEEDSETTLTQEQQEQQQQQQQQHQRQQEKPAEPHGDVPERAQAPVQASAPEPTTMQAAQVRRMRDHPVFVRVRAHHGECSCSI